MACYKVCTDWMIKSEKNIVVFRRYLMKFETMEAVAVKPDAMSRWRSGPSQQQLEPFDRCLPICIAKTNEVRVTKFCVTYQFNLFIWVFICIDVHGNVEDDAQNLPFFDHFLSFTALSINCLLNKKKSVKK